MATDDARHPVHGYGLPEGAAAPGAVRGPDLHRRLSWPDSLFTEVEAGRDVPGLWMSHEGPEASTMLEAPGHGAFVRVLLPVRLDDGGSMTYGVWWRVTPEAMRHAFEIWTTDGYADLRLDGTLANDVPPGGVVGARGTCLVRDPDHTPSADDSTHPLLARLLCETWSAGLHR